MKRPILLVPLPAWILAIAMFGFGGLPLAVACTWLLPIAVTVAEKDRHSICEIPTEMYLFPKVPTWIDPHSTLFSIVNYGTLILALGSASIGVILSVKVWCYLVVKRFHWMTEEQVQTYLKRIADRG